MKYFSEIYCKKSNENIAINVFFPNALHFIACCWECLHQERSSRIIFLSNFFLRNIVQYRAMQYRTFQIAIPPCTMRFPCSMIPLGACVPKHGCPDNPDVALTVRALPTDPSGAEPHTIEFAPGDWITLAGRFVFPPSFPLCGCFVIFIRGPRFFMPLFYDPAVCFEPSLFPLQLTLCQGFLDAPTHSPSGNAMQWHPFLRIAVSGFQLSNFFLRFTQSRAVWHPRSFSNKARSFVKLTQISNPFNLSTLEMSSQCHPFRFEAASSPHPISNISDPARPPLNPTQRAPYIIVCNVGEGFGWGFWVRFACTPEFLEVFTVPYNSAAQPHPKVATIIVLADGEVAGSS